MIDYRKLFIILALVCMTTLDGNAQSAQPDTTSSNQFYSNSSPFKNALRSTLIPGWGVEYATNGEKNGFSRTATVFALFAGGYASTKFSESSYDRYLKERRPSKVDSRYRIANTSHLVAIGLLATGVAVWAYDIVWVFKTSRNSKKRPKSISMSIASNNNSVSLTYVF